MIIYLIASELNNETLYKIGVTKRNINKRLNELKTGNPATLSVLYTFNSKYARIIETHFHHTKKVNNIRGEWFNLSQQEIIDFIPTCKIIHDNLEYLSKNNTWIMEKKLL
jgi:T5orf172 domain